MSTLHIFIHVSSRQEDVFAGVRKSLEHSTQQQDTCVTITLGDHDYEYIENIEFTFRKYARFLYYGAIFRKIEKSVVDVLEKYSDQKSVIFYLAEEGVWAQVVRDLIQRHTNTKTTLLVNVQHGVDHFLGINFLWLRKILNFMARKSFGYPIFGYGFGGSTCDIHLVYGDQEVAFLSNRPTPTPLGIACPRLIKYDLIQQHRKSQNIFPVEDDLILLALPPSQVGHIGTGWHCNFKEYLETILPAVKQIKERFGYQILLRPHPSKSDDATIELIHQSPLAPFVEIDLQKKLIPGLSRSAVVMASGSTVLFDAYCLGKVPVAISSHCFDETPPFEHELIDLRKNFSGDLDRILTLETIEHYRSIEEIIDLDWKSKLAELLVD
jgi:hypothetical protein